MWLTDKLKETEEGIISLDKTAAGGIKPVLCGEGTVSQLLPYGLYAALPANQQVYCIGGMVAGAVSTQAENLPEIENGEVCLYGKGGYILIKNNGDVVINGKVLSI